MSVPSMWGRLTTCAAVDYRRWSGANGAGGRLTIGRSLPSCPTSASFLSPQGVARHPTNRILNLKGLNLVSHPTQEEGRQPPAQNAPPPEGTGAPAARQNRARLPADAHRQTVQSGPAGRPQV